ncbi:MAG: hypothetical protein ACOH1J_02655 [Microbacteriaceae bacterium]
MAPTGADKFPAVRDMAWSRVSARIAGGDKELERLKPAAIHVEEGMGPRSFAVFENVRESMRSVGQLVPLIVAADTNVLLDGATRLAAAKELGLPFVLVVKVENLDELGRVYMRIVSNSDAYRSSFTVLEAVALANRYRVLLSEKVKSNQSFVGAERTAINAGRLEVPNLGTSREVASVGDAAKVAAEAVPYGHETIRKVNRLQALAADSAQSDVVRSAAVRALEEIGRTNKVDGPFRRAEDIVMAQRMSERLNTSNDADAQVDLSKPWPDLGIASSKAQSLLRVDRDAVVQFGHEASGAHLVFLPRLEAIRDWIAGYEEVCRNEQVEVVGRRIGRSFAEYPGRACRCNALVGKRRGRWTLGADCGAHGRASGV